MIHGGCLCGKLRFAINGRIDRVYLCHCEMCRKAQGALFTANGIIDRNQFHWTSDASTLKQYESSSGKFRCFCEECGSPIYKYIDNLTDTLIVRLGSLDDFQEINPTAHIWFQEKVSCYDLLDHIPKYLTSVQDGNLLQE